MENINNTQSILDENLVTAEYPKIYSRNAIRGFAILCTTVFGGILLYQNLKDIGNKKAANTVLFFSMSYFIVEMLISNIIPHKGSSLSLLLNLGGATVLSEYFFRKYFPKEKEYPNKKIWKPLIIALIVFTALFGLAFYVIQFGR